MAQKYGNWMRIKKRIKRFFTQSRHFRQKVVYNDEYLSSEDDKLKNVLDECQKKFVSDTVIPEASISEVDDLCKEIAKIMRLFASEKEITLNKNEVSEIRNIFEKVLSRLTNQSDTVWQKIKNTI